MKRTDTNLKTCKEIVIVNYNEVIVLWGLPFYNKETEKDI